MTRERSRYPLATAALERLAPRAGASPSDVLVPFTVGPEVLRAPAPVARPARETFRGALFDDPRASDGDRIGAVVDLVLVSTEEDARGGGGARDACVHLVFKNEVLGGLRLALRQGADGLHAVFSAESDHAARAVEVHLAALVAHLRERGIFVVSHALVVDAGSDLRAP